MEELYRLVADPERVVLSGIEEKYLSDTLGRRKGTAAALVFPVSTEEVSAVLRFAWERRLPVTPRGAGTNLVGSTVPEGQGIILDLSRMDRILELDPDTFTVTVEPGVVLQDLQRYVEERGFFYPPDPGEKLATIGGNIATNAGGMRAVKYGVTRDYVRGLEVVLADGTVLTLGSKNVKDASGLSLRHLMIGSEGTLGRGPLRGPEGGHRRRPRHPVLRRGPHGGGIRGAQRGRAGRAVHRHFLPLPAGAGIYPVDFRRNTR